MYIKKIFICFEFLFRLHLHTPPPSSPQKLMMRIIWWLNFLWLQYICCFSFFCRCTLWAQEKCHNSLLQSFNLLCQLNNDHSFVRPKMNIAKFYWIPRAFEFECVVSYNISNFIVLIICFICCCSFQRSRAILKSSRLIPKCTIQTHMFVYTYTNTYSYKHTHICLEFLQQHLLWHSFFANLL